MLPFWFNLGTRTTWIIGRVVSVEVVTVIRPIPFIDGSYREVTQNGLLVLYQKGNCFVSKVYTGNMSGTWLVPDQINLTGAVPLSGYEDLLIVVNFVAKSFDDVDDYLHNRAVSPTLCYRNN